MDLEIKEGEQEEEVGLIYPFIMLWYRKKLILFITLIIAAIVVLLSAISFALPYEETLLTNKYNHRTLIKIESKD